MIRTMLAGRLDLDTRAFSVEEVPVPIPGPGEVLVEMRAAGVCLSDVHLIDGTLTPMSPVEEVARSRKVTLGHEVAGVVHAHGPDLKGYWAPGTRVVLQSGRNCDHCASCIRRGPCEQALVLGVDYDGGWAEYVVAREESLVRIPDSLPFEQAAIIPDAVSTPYSALVESGAVRPAQSVGLWGVGGLGAHAVRIARMIGAVPVIAVDPLPSARERALAFGADLALDPADPGFAQAVDHATGGRGLDVAFDFAGHPAVREQATPLLTAGGSLVLVGLTPEPVTIQDSITFAFSGKQIRGHLGSMSDHVQQLIALTTAGRLDLAPSISDRVPLADAADAVSRLEKKIGDPIRIVLTR